MNESQFGDYIVYTDAGSFFIKPIKLIIDEMTSSDEELFLFELPLVEGQWSNKSTISTIFGSSNLELLLSNQVSANLIIVKKTKNTINFIDEYLELSQNRILLTDFGTKKYPHEISDFIEHRHDQSILSLLCKKNKISTFSDPTDYGEFPYRYINSNRIFKLLDKERNYGTCLLANKRESIYIYYPKYIFRKLLSKIFKNAINFSRR